MLERSTKAESPGILKAGDSPKSLAYWQGRTEEIAKIQQWLIDENTFLIGIEGIGGTGKSTLAAKIYDEIGGFPKRFWADVGNGASFSDLARKVLQEFGFSVPEQEAQLVEALIRCLRTHQFLLIIDNLESVLQADRQWGSLFYGDFFNAWVESGSKSKVIVTTRERPELPKGFAWLTLKGLQLEEGVALLTTLGIRGNLAEFVKLVDGHPLLLRLVADLLKEEYSQDPDLSRLADLGLGNLQQLLTDPQVVGVHRRANVGMVLVLDASFARLSELQKALLLNISVYRGAIDSAAALAVLLGSSEAEIEQELRNLVKRSLLVEKLNGKRRFEFQPVVLEYVRYKAGNQREAHQRAINYYLLNVKQKPWQTKEDIKEYLELFYHWFQLKNYDLAFDNILFCNEFLTLQGYYTTLGDVYGQLRETWDKTGEQETWKYWFSINELGNTYYSLGQYKQAIEYYKQCWQIAIKIRSHNAEGSSLGNLGNVYHALTDYQQAIFYHNWSLQIARENKDSNAEGTSLNNLGNAHNLLNDYEKAIKYYYLCWQIRKKTDDPNGESNCLNNLGVIYRRLGKPKKAIKYLQQSLQIQKNIEYGKIGDRRGEANAWLNLGGALMDVNRKSDALGAYRKAREMYQKMGLDADVQNCNNAIERLSQP
ncbi:tetratricopeptide repeat protein [Nodularia sp. UHCC 0506]|uniref:tetratricopeptide repeat protein n=1 Tax=Nodularia sp. UHCC 0506 TaxID=3110243 RepID=UPI002B20D36D|nr:tetratricopeptide repeat protein [Nodularia sp. UHCC 0506]MEA5512824.1 tetratricopeptide repeat protein [Nodularia sp. UHCC 0506]